MAVEFPNSMFVHIPKCGGRWGKSVMESFVKGYKTIGDPIYDSHCSPNTDKPVFCFIREPATFAHSLWHQRAKKKPNKFGHKWNWQEYIYLERSCKNTDYTTFMKNVSNCTDGVEDYYNHYIGKYKSVHFIRVENLAEELMNTLDILGETYNREGIVNSSRKLIGKGTAKFPVSEDIRIAINQANTSFCKKFNYPI